SLFVCAVFPRIPLSSPTIIAVQVKAYPSVEVREWEGLRVYDRCTLGSSFRFQLAESLVERPCCDLPPVVIRRDNSFKRPINIVWSCRIFENVDRGWPQSFRRLKQRAFVDAHFTS